jgi:hypothetical protein
MMRRLLSVIALLFVLPAALGAQDRSLAIETFDTRIVVGVDRSLDITERITFRFDGSWNGVYRMVPLEYRTSTGFQWTIRADLIEATDERGTVLEVEQLRERHYRKFKIWVPGAQNTTKTITLRYRVDGGLRFFEEHDELYWNATGDEWDVALGMVTAEVVLGDLLQRGLRLVRHRSERHGHGGAGGLRDAAASPVSRRVDRRRGMGQGTDPDADDLGEALLVPPRQLAPRGPDPRVRLHVLDLEQAGTGSGPQADRGPLRAAGGCHPRRGGDAP